MLNVLCVCFMSAWENCCWFYTKIKKLDSSSVGVFVMFCERIVVDWGLFLVRWIILLHIIIAICNHYIKLNFYTEAKKCTAFHAQYTFVVTISQNCECWLLYYCCVVDRNLRFLWYDNTTHALVGIIPNLRVYYMVHSI